MADSEKKSILGFKLFSFSGKLNRKEYFVCLLILTMLMSPAWAFHGSLFENLRKEYLAIFIIWMILYFWLSFAFGFKRLRDIGFPTIGTSKQVKKRITWAAFLLMCGFFLSNYGSSFSAPFIFMLLLWLAPTGYLLDKKEEK